MKLPEKFVETIINAWGAKGGHWLKGLPNLISKCQQQWSLHKLQLVENLSVNCVFRAYRESDSSPVILKLSLSSEFEQEIRCLQVYNGHGAVKLLDVDLEKKACLLEALEPGYTLKTFFPENDDKAVLIMIDVMKKLHNSKLPEDLSKFPTIQLWLSAFNKINEFPFASLIKKASIIAAALLQDQKSVVLLHGDLHHDNILQNGEQWTSIDPKGVIGETAYEVGAFIRNPIPELFEHSDPLGIIQKRIELFSLHLNIEPSRLRKWVFVQSVLSACWAYEDKDNWKMWVNCAELLKKLI